MKCPFCSAPEDKVIDSRSIKDKSAIRRRRECLTCGRRFTTYERIEETMPLVMKKNGERETFNRNKILEGILAGCYKRPVSQEQIELLVVSVEKSLQDMEVREISSSIIGREVMKHLKKIDKVAYIRFASVYKDFKDPEDFVDQVEEFRSKK
ncbi:MAG: transcriptional regulator NrdR [bacterium]